MSKISVIVPVYGVELYIESCQRSIAAQTFSDFELILVDDGCLDRSVELAEAYLRTTALNWRVLHQEKRRPGACPRPWDPGSAGRICGLYRLR